MKRSGFTMIELVFVIVILGILASVAIPKLAATRDDAMIAKSTSEVSSLISDMGSYYTARGSFHTKADKTKADIDQITNVKLFASDGTTPLGAGTAITNGEIVASYIDEKRSVKCLKITMNDVNGTVSLVSDGNNTGSIFCTGLVSALTENGMLKTYTFGGSSIYGSN